MKGEKAAWIEIAEIDDGQIWTSSTILICANSNCKNRIFEVSLSESDGHKTEVAESTIANELDANNWVGFGVKTKHFDESVLQISLVKDGNMVPSLVANLTKWGSYAPTHVSFSYGQEPVRFKELRGEDTSVEPSSCSGEIEI